MNRLINFVDSKVDWELFESTFPNMVLELSNTPQDEIFHSEGDVWTHTKLVVNELIQSSDWKNLNKEEQQITWLAALLHDIGKPATTKIEGDRITSKGHSRRGAADARILLWRESVDWHIRESVCQIINTHQNPFHAVLKDDIQTKLKQWSQIQRLDLLALVTMSDARGRETNPSKLKTDAIENVELFKLMASDLNILRCGYPFSDNYTWQKFLNSPTTCDPSYSIFKPEKRSKVKLMSGLPGMGKDLWISKNCPNETVLSYDDMRETLNVNHGEDEGTVIHAVWDKAKELLRQKKDFVWNATHLSQSMRKKALDLLWNYDAEVEIVYIEVSEEKKWRQQNLNRGDKAVPNKALNNLLFKWEPPTLREAEHVTYWIDGINKTYQYNNILNIQESLTNELTINF